jgi:alpha-ketoglutarate-dependent taurine dioxygenase
MAQLRVRDLTPDFGAEIEGLDPRAPLDDEQCRFLRRAFDERGLLVFRGLELDVDEQSMLAGTLIGESGSAAGDAPEEPEAAAPAREIFVSNKEPGGNAPYGRLLFHADMMWSDTPFQVLTLYGVDVEQPAVPTAFASMGRAWQALPEDLRARVEASHALHITGQQARGGYDDEELLQPIREHARSTTTAVGHRHPRTGRTMLYVSQMMTQEIVELPADESEALLEVLFAHLYDPEHLWEHEWRNGDLVAWDNLAIQHARSDVRVDGPARTLRKVVAPMPVLSQLEAPKFSTTS